MYANLKEKLKKKIDIETYENEMANFLVSMFETTGENPFTTHLWDRCEFELLLLLCGKLAVWKDENKLVFSHVDFIGNIDFMGIGKNANCTTLNGHNKVFLNWRDNKDVVIIFNNENHSPDFNIGRYSDLMTETWVSMRSAVIGTRYSKVLTAGDEKEKAVIETNINNVKDGKPLVLVSRNLFNLGQDGNSVNTLKLTDFQESDKIQYLSTFATFLERNFINKYGMASQGSDKVAQQNEAEIKNGAFSAWVEVLSRLSERKKGFAEVKEKFDVDINYGLSEVWKKEYKRLFEEVEEEQEVQEEQEEQEVQEEQEEQEEIEKGVE